jgi:hypothetical protein
MAPTTPREDDLSMGTPPIQRSQGPNNGIFNKESLHQKNKGNPMVHLHNMAVQKSQLLV